MRIGKTDGAHSRCERGRKTIGGVLDDDAALRGNAQKIGRYQEDVGSGFAAQDARMVAAYDGRKDREPIAMTAGLHFEERGIGAGGDRNGNPAPMKVARECFRAGDGFGFRQERFQERLALFQVLRGRDGKLEFFDEKLAESKAGRPMRSALTVQSNTLPCSAAMALVTFV